MASDFNAIAAQIIDRIRYKQQQLEGGTLSPAAAKAVQAELMEMARFHDDAEMMVLERERREMWAGIAARKDMFLARRAHLARMLHHIAVLKSARQRAEGAKAESISMLEELIARREEEFLEAKRLIKEYDFFIDHGIAVQRCQYYQSCQRQQERQEQEQVKEEK